jgi:hypothetical protein
MPPFCKLGCEISVDSCLGTLFKSPGLGHGHRDIDTDVETDVNTDMDAELNTG